MRRDRNGNRKNVICLGIILLFAISLLTVLLPSLGHPAASILNNSEMPRSSQLVARDLSPLYTLRSPIAYDLEGQPLTVYGDLSTLTSEDSVLYLRHDFVGTSGGSTHIIFTLSTAGIALDANHTLMLNWEAHGSGDVLGYVINTTIKTYIEYQEASWMPIHSIVSTSEQIARAYGWQEFTIPAPYADYVTDDEIKIKIELAHQLTSPRMWIQRLYIRWVLLEVRHDVSANTIDASQITLHTPGVEVTGNASALLYEDDERYRLERSTAPAEEGVINFTVEYDLGYFASEPLLGFQLSHFDWVMIEGGGISTMSKRIYIAGESDETFLCYFRDNFDEPVIPPIQHATSLMLGDWAVNQSIRLLYQLEYAVTEVSTIHVYLDWASLQIVRNPDPVVVATLLNTTIYAEQTIWLNVTCLDGKAPITEMRLAPWDALIGNSAGGYLYSRFIESVGEFILSITVKDADGDVFIYPVGTVTVLHRSISIALYLSEDPFLQEFVIDLYLKDILSNNPLPFYPFTKIILKDGAWFRQQAHQTGPAGTFSIHESVIDYLDWNYTVIIETAETPVYAATSVYASIILSECPPFLFIHDLFYEDPLKANTDIILNYTVMCQIDVDALWLCKNFTLFQPIPTALGTFNFTFQDVAGCWEYYLYANNSRGFEGYSSPANLNISPWETKLTLESALNLNDHAIVLEVDLVDELNRSCPGVPLRLVIYDFGETFYSQEVVTGMDGIMLLVHFDQYLDHSFTIYIASEETALYEGALLMKGGLYYEGYPLYSIIGVGVAFGVVTVTLCIIKRRIKPQ